MHGVHRHEKNEKNENNASRACHDVITNGGSSLTKMAGSGSGRCLGDTL